MPGGVLACPVLAGHDGRVTSELGERIKRLREARRLRGQSWRLEDVAAALGVSTRTLGRWENEGTMPRSAIGALEEFYGVKLTGQLEAPDPDEELLMTLDLDPKERAKLIDFYRSIRSQHPRRKNSA